MRLHLNSLAGALALALATTAGAQAQKATPAQPATPATPAIPPSATQPTTTVPDEPGTPQSTAPGQTETTPGQMQTSPGDASQQTPAQTGQTPSGQSVTSQAADKTQVTAVTKADVKAGASIHDQSGGVVGKIDSVSAKGAVLDTGTVKVTIPLSSIAKGDNGLVISMTKAEIDAAAKKKGGK